jgi:hypothetical protein
MATMDCYWTDTNGDSVGDYGYCDTNGDGYYDTISVDTNYDGVIDSYSYDSSGDGRSDTFTTDLNEDGVIEYTGWDSDENGRLDYYADASTGWTVVAVEPSVDADGSSVSETAGSGAVLSFPASGSSGIAVPNINDVGFDPYSTWSAYSPW